MYQNDSDERFPQAARWSDLITRYVAKPERLGDDWFRCPAAETRGSYGFNASLDGARMSRIEAPASTVLLFEADALTRSFAGGPRDVARKRHVGGSNYGFADGHAKRVNAAGMSTPNWASKPPNDSRARPYVKSGAGS
jgi:prepilin-type processing-associated H-X9-DG protein